VTFFRSVELKPSAPDSDGGHSFDVPAIMAMAERQLVLRLDPAVTVFVGDNGSGKSTLLEAIAVSQGMNAERGARGMQIQTRDGTVSTLHQHLRVLRSPRPPDDMFFLSRRELLQCGHSHRELRRAFIEAVRRISAREVSR
jgi:predicted ATPase